jgi:light-regulated signal transduction histidine kinase (bacteriophytochrome)
LGLALPSTQVWHIRWWLLLSIEAIAYVLAFIYMVAVFRRLQEEIVSTTRRLEDSNEELENFAYIASHDLQEPLRMITSYMRLLKDRYQGKLDRDANEFIVFAVDGAVRMRKLIDDLLAYSRFSRQTVPLEEVDCAEVMGQVLRNLRLQIEENQASVVTDPLPKVWASGSLLEQVFQNLLSNAIKFRSKAAPEIRIRCKESNGAWLFAVSDNGIGFPSDDGERIFQLFQRLNVRKEYPGSGIGLATCQRILERLNGKIWAESQPGQGSTFYFTLPPLPK